MIKTTSKCNTDISLTDRRNEFIKNNMSLCEENCELSYYNYYIQRAKCSCKTKTILSLNNNESNSKNFLKNFIDIKTFTNIEIIKCYKILFNKNNIKNNYGFFILFFIFLLYLICIIIFYCKSLKNLIDIIKNIFDAKNNEKNHINKEEKYDLINENKLKSIRKKNKKKTKMENKSSIKEIKKEKNIIILKKNLKIKYNKKENTNQKEIMKKKNHKGILDYTDSELNSLDYQEALKKDRRTYIQYYISLIKQKQSILFSFYPNKDFNSQIIKSFLFFFFYASDMTINALFFTDDTMHKI